MFMKLLYVFILLLFSCGVFAQEEDYNSRLQEQLNSINRLKQDTIQLREFIAKEKERLYQLKKTWYDICINYLKEGNFKIDELDKLIRDTKRDIDGEALYNELTRAKTCYEAGESYIFQTVPPPTKADPILNKGAKEKKKKVVPKDDSSKKSEKKDPEVKKPEQKEKKDSKTPVEDPKNPTTPVVNPEVKDKPIESDPKKDKPGDEKVIVETPVKNDNPPVEPETPKKDPVAPVKNAPKKADKGEMEEGMSKKSKNNDGSN